MTFTDWGRLAIVLSLIIIILLAFGALLAVDGWRRGRKPQPPTAEEEAWLRGLLTDTVIDDALPRFFHHVPTPDAIGAEAERMLAEGGDT